jgi:tetratricopeptide (TPR) repeat protein
VRVEPLGEIVLKGRQGAIEAFRLLDVDRSAAGHERHLDSPMVGRERPGRLLAEAFAEVRDERVCHLFTVLGTAGVGKSRLVNEFVASVGGDALVLQGRCLSYGEGITYWPMAELVRAVIGPDVGGADDEMSRLSGLLQNVPDGDRVADRVAMAIGLSRGEPAPEEIPWAFRTLLEALAAERPLVIVLDDLQWAEPALLDLVDHIVDWSQDAPILLVVLARRELLDLRPSWGGGKRSATTISLEPLNADETAQLIDNLLGQAHLPATVFDRIRSVAEGNPLFVEELLEMLIDDGTLSRAEGTWEVRRDLSATAMPPTIQALLSARLDGLGAPERAVLERASVEGTVFHRDAVTALAPDSLREVVGPSLQSLTRREFVAPDRAELVGHEAFRFRHQLIRDAAYQAIAKQSRADLHQRFAEWLELALAGRLDEYRPILGYHLEQAVRYRTELDAGDTQLAALGHRAAEHLGLAGMAALGRGDLNAAANLLRRATALEREPAAAIRWRLFAVEAMATGGTESGTRAAEEFTLETRALAETIGDRRAAAQAEVLRIHLRVAAGTESLASIANDADALRRTLAELGNTDGAARAAMERAKLMFWSGQAGPAFELASGLLEQPIESARLRDEIRRWAAAFAYWGPMPADEALVLVQRLRAELDLPSSEGAHRLKRNIGGLLAARGEFDDARRIFQEEWTAFHELGDRAHLASLESHFMGPVELLAGNPRRAIELERRGLATLLELGAVGFANTAAAELARAALAAGELDEAERAANSALELGVEDDPAAVPPALGVLARIAASRGDYSEAERLARRGVAIVEPTDHLERIAESSVDLAEVLVMADRIAEAERELETALDLYRRKGHLVGVARTESRLAAIRAAEAAGAPGS